MTIGRAFSLALALSLPAALLAASSGDYEKAALLKEGNKENGHRLFMDQERTLCAKCHAYLPDEKRVAPNLHDAGDKFGRQDLITAILQPSASIAVGYSTTQFVLDDGDALEGILQDNTTTSVSILTSANEPVTIPLAQIRRRSTSDVSMMPEGLAQGLSVQEFTDLIEFLVSLKAPATTELASHGMPAEIKPLSKPISFEAFHDTALDFEHPVWFGPLPGILNAFIVVEHESGIVWVLDQEHREKRPFARFGRFDKGTRGLIGIVFHPDYARNRRYFYARHMAVDSGFATFVFEGKATPDGQTDSGHPPQIVLRMDATSNVHYGGSLQFGPDGFLYIGMGDTGPQGDPRGNGQNGALHLGKILRVDVDHPSSGLAYTIPADNPFRGSTEMRPEIWALGFREPWRFTFDSVTHDLWVGDVGQDRYEEVDLVRKGENYGWNVYEAFERFSNKYERPNRTFAPPVFAYPHKVGVSVTGGYVYHGRRSPSFDGVYIFGDYQTQIIWGLTQTDRHLKTIRQLGLAPQKPVSFGCDNDGELFVVGYDGRIFRMHLENSFFQ